MKEEEKAEEGTVVIPIEGDVDEINRKLQEVKDILDDSREMLEMIRKHKDNKKKGERTD